MVLASLVVVFSAIWPLCHSFLEVEVDRGHPVNIPIRRTMHLSSIIPANDTQSLENACLDTENFLAVSRDRIWDL